MKKIIQFFKNLFNKDSKLKFIEAAVEVVNAIKKVADSPALDVVTALTKTKIDNIILAKVRTLLPLISEQLLRQHGKISTGTTMNEDDVLRMLVELINEYKDSKDNKTNLLTSLAAKLLQGLTDGTIDYYQAKEETQKLYEDLKKFSK